MKRKLTGENEIREDIKAIVCICDRLGPRMMIQLKASGRIDEATGLAIILSKLDPCIVVPVALAAIAGKIGKFLKQKEAQKN